MRRTLGAIGWLAAAAASAHHPAHAQPAAGTAAPDAASIITLDIENDAVAQTDRYYSSGLRANYVSPTGAVPDFLAQAGHVLWGGGQQRVSLGLSQSIFTPANTQINPPDPTDRPYAAELTLNSALIQDTPDFRSVLGLDLGVAGPAALGRQVQNGFHDIIGDTPNRGWSYQIRNEPLIEITTERTYRVPMADFGGIETDILPELTVGLGNERIYAQTGAQVRLGQGLASDYGAARIRPGLSGTDAYTPSRPFAWYVFAGLDGQAIARDITLNGNSFEDSRHVSIMPLVGEGEAGVAAMLFGVKLSYTEVVQTHEFHGQASGLFQFGLVTLSARF